MEKEIIKEGDKYNRLTAIKLDFVKQTKCKDKRNKSGISFIKRPYWVFKCDCGNEKTILVNRVKTGNTKSCGCLMSESMTKYNQENKRHAYGEAAKNGLLKSYINGAVLRNYSFELTNEEFFWFTKQDCFYCGNPPVQPMTKSSPSYFGDYLYNGIDRVENTIGYTFDNCVTCCTDCNMSKGKKSIEKFTEWIKRLVNHNKHLIED